MTQVAVGCLMGVGGWLGIAAAISWVLQTRYGHSITDTLGGSALAGLLGFAAVNLRYSAWTNWRQRAAIAGGIAGVRPSNGQGAVLVGTLQPLGATLRAPLDGTACVLYTYEVTEDRGTGRRRTIVTHFKGVALAPSVIVTPTGSFKLLTVPDLEAVSPRGATAERVAAFERYASATTFTGRDTSAQELVDRWSDADGAYRSDVAYAAMKDVVLSTCLFAQQHVPVGAKVCVFGTFSSEKGGIVPSSGWAATPRLVQGNVDEVVSKLRSMATTRLALGLLATAGAAGLVAAFING